MAVFSLALLRRAAPLAVLALIPAVLEAAPQGATLVKDLYPGPGSSNPHSVDRVLELSQRTRDRNAEAHTALLFRNLFQPVYAGSKDAFGDALFWVHKYGMKPLQKMRPAPRDDFASLGARAVGRSSNSQAFAYATGMGTWYDSTKGDLGRELVMRRYDKTSVPAPLGLLADINPGPGSSDPWPHVSTGDSIFFSANDGTHGRELWTTRGTKLTTRLVLDINSGSNSSMPSQITAWNRRVIFSASDNGSGNHEPWISDGTAAGTKKLKEINPATSGSYPGNFLPIGSRVWFSANDGSNGYEVWSTDGTSAGTRLEKDLNPGAASSFASSFHAFNQGFLFSGRDGKTGQELWYCDATKKTFGLVKDINPSGDSNPVGFTPFLNGCLFTADDGSHGLEPWFTDGTAAGTRLLKDINVGTKGSVPYGIEFLVIGSRFAYFVVNDGVHGEELWISDGTLAGTRMVADIYPGAIGSMPYDFRYFGGLLYFAANEPKTGTELWAVSTGAVSTFAGISCGEAWLWMSDPVIGTVMRIQGLANASALGGVVFLGTQAPGVVSFGPRCFLSSWLPLLPILTFAGGGPFTGGFAIPKDNSLQGLELMFQSIHFLPSTLGDYEMSNGSAALIGF